MPAFEAVKDLSLYDAQQLHRRAGIRRFQEADLDQAISALGWCWEKCQDASGMYIGVIGASEHSPEAPLIAWARFTHRSTSHALSQVLALALRSTQEAQ